MEDCGSRAASLFLKSLFLPPKWGPFSPKCTFLESCSPNLPFLTPNFPFVAQKWGIIWLSKWRCAALRWRLPSAAQCCRAEFPKMSPFVPKMPFFTPKLCTLRSFCPTSSPHRHPWGFFCCSMCFFSPAHVHHSRPKRCVFHPQNEHFFTKTLIFGPKMDFFSARMESLCF